jgi:hypothetical protein
LSPAAAGRTLRPDRVMGAGAGKWRSQGKGLDVRARLLLTDSTIDTVSIAMFDERCSRLAVWM